MTIFLIGINHKTASVSKRETVNSETLYHQIRTQWFPQIFSEILLLSTCNRTEIYLITNKKELGKETANQLFKNLNPYFYTDQEAIKHFYQVACGIDSMVIGESEILGQIKNAYKSTTQNKTIGPVLHQLCKEALHLGKNIHTTTQIGKGVTSISHASILLAKKHIPNLEKTHITIIGAGIMAHRLIKNLQQENCFNLSVSNRSYKHAQELAQKYNCKPEKLSHLEQTITTSDLIISATASPSIILTASTIKKAMQKRPDRPLHIIDLAVPRDIDSKATTIKNVHLYNLDEIQLLVKKNLKVRKESILLAEKYIQIASNSFWQWFLSRQAIPLLIALRQKAQRIQTDELNRTLNKLNYRNLNDKEKNNLALLSHRITNKLLAKPMINLKKYMQDEQKQIYLEVIKELFELEN